MSTASPAASEAQDELLLSVPSSRALQWRSYANAGKIREALESFKEAKMIRPPSFRDYVRLDM
jgi:hypothetical protein